MDLLTQVLAQHADQLNTDRGIPTDALLAQCPERRDELASLLDTAARIERTLKPVAPEPAFRARLRAGLLMAAHHQQVHHVLIAQRAESQWGWLLGAAALGSAAGLIAMMLRARAQTQREIARVPTA